MAYPSVSPRGSCGLNSGHFDMACVPSVSHRVLRSFFGGYHRLNVRTPRVTRIGPTDSNEVPR